LTPSEVLREEMQSLREDWVKAYEALGMRASGQWAKELGEEVLESTAKLVGKVVGVHYTYYLQHGRKPGKRPPISVIKQWIKDKGIGVLDRKQTITSLAFAIATAIAKKGTKYFQQGGTDLIERVLTPQRIQQVIDRVGEAILADQIVDYTQKVQGV